MTDKTQDEHDPEAQQAIDALVFANEVIARRMIEQIVAKMEQGN
jgi:hypothetical protein